MRAPLRIGMISFPVILFVFVITSILSFGDGSAEVYLKYLLFSIIAAFPLSYLCLRLGDDTENNNLAQFVYTVPFLYGVIIYLELSFIFNQTFLGI